MTAAEQRSTSSVRSGGPASLPPTGTGPGGPPMNLMFDPRVVRGPTFSKLKSAVESVPEKKIAPRKKRKIPAFSTTPPPLDGRKNLDIQTDVYLEELVERISEYDVDTQTDPFLDRPATPLFIPQKPGPDIGTQIEEGDLFNFDEEVEPMLEVLVGRTVEQAWMEVTEERQLAELHKHQDHFEKIRAAELVATQRMEFSEWRKVEEKKRRVDQEKKRIEEERLLKEKIETQNYAREYLKKMTDSVIAYLESEGYFYDPVEREVESIFLPMLADQVEKELEKIVSARNSLHCLVEAAVIPKETRAENAVSSILNNIVMKIEAQLTEFAIHDADDAVKDVLEMVEKAATEVTTSSREYMKEFMEYFDSIEFQVLYEVRSILRRIVVQHAEEEFVRVEIGEIMRRVVALHVAEEEAQLQPSPPPPPPPTTEEEEEIEEEGG